jgi:Rps23 Pro-64 3,4-dihydroxylase Tpa1-like proline 4-hydroxylase
MKHAVEMGSGGMMYIPSFMTTGSKVISPTISEAAVLVLLKGRIYEVAVEMALYSMVCNTMFHDDRFRHSSNIKVTASTI